MRKPKEIISIFYNNNNIDCYTFVLKPEYNLRSDYLDCVATCSSGREFSQYSSCTKNWADTTEDKKVKWSSLGNELKIHIINRLK